MLLKGLILATAALFAMPATAQTFDFEAQPLTNSGTYTSLPLTSGGLTMTLSRQGGGAFDVNSAAPTAPTFGQRSLSPFFASNSGAFVADFSSDLSFLSVEMGDFAPSDEDTLTLDIFSGLGGTGTLLGSTSFFYGSAGFPTTHTLSLSSATGFRSAVVNGGSQGFPNSVYYDNFIARVGGVPEPGTWAMMLLGFGAIGYSSRRRKVRALAQNA